MNITASLLDTEEVIDSIRNNVIILYIILLVLLFTFNKVLLQRLWRPFYITLENLKQYRLDKDPHMSFDKTYINEFRELNQTISLLIQKNNQVYQNQKQFIENASHELQTPLARAAGKIEHLIQHSDLSYDIAQVVQSINDDLEKLSGLNRSLLLLSKIENEQFHENEEVNIGNLTEKMGEEYADFIAFKKVEWSLVKEKEIVKFADPFLMEILLRNLIKNSIYHNIPGGVINIIVTDNKIVIENTGKEFVGNTDRLFNRFTKNSDNKESLGLGLAIVKAICRLYGLRISYTVEKGLHKVIVLI